MVVSLNPPTSSYKSSRDRLGWEEAKDRETEILPVGFTRLPLWDEATAGAADWKTVRIFKALSLFSVFTLIGNEPLGCHCKHHDQWLYPGSSPIASFRNETQINLLPPCLSSTAFQYHSQDNITEIAFHTKLLLKKKSFRNCPSKPGHHRTWCNSRRRSS